MQTSDNRKGASFRMHFPYIHTYRQRDRQTDRHTDIHTDIHTYIHTHTHIHTYTHPHIHTCTHAHTHTRTHAHTHTYTHTHTHRHTDTQTYRHTDITLHYIPLHCIALQYSTLHYITYTHIYIILFKICFSAYNTRTLQKIVSNCPQTILYITRQKLWLRQSLLETLFSHCPQSRSSTANWLSMCPNNVN